MHGIEFRDVAVRYGSNTVLHDLSLAIAPSEFLALLGPSGCGKTTMLRVLAGFVPYSGSVRLDGKPIDAIPTHRRGIGIVFQDYALFPHRTVAENIAFGLRMRSAPAATIARRVEEMLDLLHLGGLGGRYPGQLSGGQQQRVALARAIAIDPPVLLLDEPLSSLDKKLREEMQIELRLLQQTVGITFVFVTHDQEEALTMSDRVAVMNMGKVLQVASPGELYEHPNCITVAGFIGQMNFLPARVTQVNGASVTLDVKGFGAAQATGRGGLADGSAVTVALRPEKLKLGAAASALPNRMQATVAAVAYLGDRSHVHLRHPALDKALLVTSQTDASVTQGSEVTVGWAADAPVLLTA